MVEWKKFGEVASFYRGVTYNKDKEVALNSGGTKILRANNITLETNSLNYDDVKEIDSSVKIRDYQWLYPNDILICAGSGSKEHVGKVAYIAKKIDYAYGGFMGKIVTSSTLRSRFLFHIITGPIFKEYLNVALNSTTINNLNSEIMNRFSFPVPSLSEQERIVGILDTFTTSIDNLKEQITQRRKQYEHYRDQLLDLEGKEGVEWKTLGEITELVTKQTGFDYSNTIKPSLLTTPQEGAIPFLQTKNFTGRNFNYNTDYFVPSYIVKRFPKIVLDKQCLLFSIVGASIGNVGLFPASKTCFLGGAICVLKFPDGANIHYVYEVMSSWIGQKQIKEKTKGAGQATITVEDARTFIIPYPKPNIQSHIVSILDTFESSIRNLEAQLAERQKQYEYYRNKLLTFE